MVRYTRTIFPSYATLSEKLLEVMYCLIGLISIYVAFKNLKDKENKNSVGSFVFWFDLGVMFVLGKLLPALADGILLIILVLPPIFKKVSPGNEPEPTLEEMEQNNKKIGTKVFVPAVCIGLFALLAAFLKIGGKTKIINKIPSSKAGNHLPSTNITPRSNQKKTNQHCFYFLYLLDF